MRGIPLFSRNYKDVRLALIIAVVAGMACGFGYWMLSKRPIQTVRIVEAIPSEVRNFQLLKDGRCIAQLTSSLFLNRVGGEKVLRGALVFPPQLEQESSTIRWTVEFDNRDNLALGTLQIVDKEVALKLALKRESEERLIMQIDMTLPKPIQSTLPIGMISIHTTESEEFFLSYSPRTEGERIFASSLKPTLLRGLSLASLQSTKNEKDCIPAEGEQRALSSYFPLLELITAVFNKMPSERANGKD